MSRHTFNSVKTVLLSWNLSVKIKKKFIKFYICSVTLNQAEASTPSKKNWREGSTQRKHGSSGKTTSHIMENEKNECSSMRTTTCATLLSKKE